MHEKKKQKEGLLKVNTIEGNIVNFLDVDINKFQPMHERQKMIDFKRFVSSEDDGLQELCVVGR